MRALVILGNFSILLFVLLQINKSGLPKLDGEFFIFLILVLSPCATLWYVFFGNRNETWLSMYMTRKALEEKKRIEELTKN